MEDQFKTFQEKVKGYVLCEFDNRREIIIFVLYIKYPYAHVNMDNINNPIHHTCYRKSKIICFRKDKTEETASEGDIVT